MTRLQTVVTLTPAQVSDAIKEYVQRHYPDMVAESVLVHYKVNVHTGPEIHKVDVEVGRNC